MGTVLYTKNGGTTWHPQTNPLAGSPTTLYRIACVGRSTCYVIGRPNTILVTRNGGLTWSVHHIPLTGVGSQLRDPACVSGQLGDLRDRPALCRLGLLDLACLNASTCYVVATIRIRPVFTSLGPAVFLTIDGGRTWAKQRIPTTALCWGDCGPGGTRTSYPLDWISCLAAMPCRAGGAIDIGSHEGWAAFVISVGKIGAPWAPTGNRYNWGFGPVPDSAVCTTALNCYGVMSTSPYDPGNVIWQTTNGGLRWSTRSSGSPRIRNGIVCPATRTCYSVGNQGSITAAENGGPFLARRSGTSHDLYGVTCVDVTRCFAVGNKGTIVAHGG